MWVLVLAAALAAEPPRCVTVSFPTDDGGIVYADLYGEGDRGLVLAHGGRFNRASWEAQAPTFVAAGFRTLAIDFRGRGLSRGGPGERSADAVHLDVLAAIRHLRESGARSVSIVGGSFGGWAASKAVAGAERGAVDRLVLLGAEMDEPERVAVRKLVLVTRDDANDAGPRLPRIQSQYDRAPEPKEMVILDGSAHAQFVFATDQGERALREILRFLTAP